ncbi:MAG: DUF2341 domain-containing protein [Planctomycetota bacterium]
MAITGNKTENKLRAFPRAATKHAGTALVSILAIAVLVLFPQTAFAAGVRHLIVRQNSTVDNNSHYYHSWQGSGRPSVAAVAGDYLTTLGDESRWLVPRAHPFKEEFLVGHLEDSTDDLSLFFYNGSNSIVVNASMDNLNSNYQSFDIAYEDYSGEALIVWAEAWDDSIYYYWYNSTHGLPTKQTLLDSDPEVPHASGEYPLWVKLVSKPRHDDIALVYSTHINDLYVMMWNGTDFTTDTSIRKELENNLENQSKGRPFDACWEDRGDQDLVVVYSNETGATRDGIWGQAYDSKDGWTTEFKNQDGSYYLDYLTMACKPGSDNIVLAIMAQNNDVVTYKWNGSDGFTNRYAIDTQCEIMAVPSEPVAVAWFMNSSDSTWDVMVCFNDLGSDRVIDWYVSWNEGVNWLFRADCGSDIINSAHGEDDFLSAYTDPNGDIYLLMQDETSNPDITLMKFDGANWTNILLNSELLETSGNTYLGRQSGMAIVDLPEPETVTSLFTPTPFQATARTVSSITWGWTDTNSSPNEEGHDIFLDSGTADSDISVRCVFEDTTTVVDTGLSANQQITRYVRAYIRGYGDTLGNAGGYEKLYSDAATNSSYTLTGQPTGFTFSLRNSNTIILTCDHPPPGTYPDLTRVKFECLEGPGGTNSGWLSTNTYADTGLSPDVTYIYRVIWRNGDGIEDAPSLPLYIVGTKCFNLLHCTVSGGSSTFPYDTMAKAFNGVNQISARIAEVNSGYSGGSDYDLVSTKKGSKVIIDGGFYNNQQFTIISFTTSANYSITIENDPGETPVIYYTSDSIIEIYEPYTVLSGICATGAGGSYYSGIVPGADNVSILNCIANNCYYGIEVQNKSDGASYADGIKVQHCRLDNNNVCGILFWGDFSNLDIYNCSVYENPSGIRIEGVYDIVFGGGQPDGVTIRNCRIYKNDNYGIELYSNTPATYKVRDVLIKENRIYDNDIAGILVADGCDAVGEPVIIRNNVIYCNSSGDMDYAIFCGSGCDYVQVINNTIYNPQYGLYQDGLSDNLVCRNNIFMIQHSLVLSYGIYCTGLDRFAEIDYNCFFRLPTGSGFGNTGYYDGDARTTLTDWKGATPAGWDVNSIETSVNIVDDGKAECHDFHLKSTAGHWNESTLSWDNDAITSTCIDAGKPSDSYSNELENNGDCINLGAYGNTQYASKTPGEEDSPLNAPTNFSGTANNASSILWSWTDTNSDPNEDGSSIFEDGGTTVVTGIAQDAESALETGLSPNTSYSRNVRGIYLGLVYSPPSNTNSAWTHAVPPDQSECIATPQSTTIELDWNNGYIALSPGNPDITTYYLQFDTDYDNNWGAGASGIYSGPNLTYSHSITPVAGTTYYYRIRSRNYTGTYTSWIYFNCYYTVPPAPTDLYVEGCDATSASLLVYDNAPEFSAIPDGAGTVTHVQVQVGTNTDWGTAEKWDSGKFDQTDVTAGTRAPDIEYGTILNDHFGDGDLSDWTMTGTADWSANSSVYRTPGYGARSGVIGSSTFSAMEQTITVPTGGAVLTFFWKASCEYEATSQYDRLEFYINGVEQDRISGDVDWHMMTYSLPAGTYPIKWRYYKDGFTVQYNDCGYVDDVKVRVLNLSPNTTYYFRMKYFYGVGDSTGSEWTGGSDKFRMGNELNHYRIYGDPSGAGAAWPYSTPGQAMTDITSLGEIIGRMNGDNNSNTSGTGFTSYDLASEKNKFTVLLDNGTYTITSAITFPSGSITDSTHYITVQNVAGQTCTITPSSTFNFDGFTIYADYTRISGMLMYQFYYAFRHYGNNCTFSYINVPDANCGWRIENGDYNTIEHSSIDFTWLGINVRDNADFTDINNCSIFGNLGQGYAGIYCGFNTEEGTTIRNCRIYNNDKNGIYIRGTIGATPYVIKNNVFYDDNGDQDYGIYVSTATADKVYIVNNTFYNHPIAAIYFINGSQNNFCNNNIICVRNSGTAYGIYLPGTVANFFTACNYNNFYRMPDGSGSGNVGYFNTAARQTLSAWNSATGYDANSSEWKPEFYEYIRAVYSMTAPANAYHYEDLDSVGDFTVNTGDYLEYDIYWTSSTDQIAFDYTTSDAFTLRASGATDQNALDAHPGTDLSAYALNSWYHRKIAIPAAHDGKTVRYCDIACENDQTAVKVGYIKNIVITDGVGTIKQVIFTNGSITHSTHLTLRGSCTAMDNNLDFHLQSPAGRWDVVSLDWENDSVISQCIDAGDPLGDYSLETEDDGNRINQGAYGGTAEASRTFVLPTSLTWTGGTSTDWTDKTNWTPQPFGSNIVGIGLYSNVDVIIDTAATFNPTVASTITLGDLSIESGRTLTGTVGTVSITGDLTGAGGLTISGAVFDTDGEFDPTTLTMSAGELYIADDDASWTWSASPTGGTIYYNGATQSICNPAGGTQYGFDYWNLNLRGSNTKNITGPHMEVLRNLTIEGVTFSLNNATQVVRANPYRYNSESAVDLSGAALVTGPGDLHSFGNCNVGGSASMNALDQFRLYCEGTTPESSCLNIADGGLINATTSYVIRQGASPCEAYFYGPGIFNSSTLHVYSDGVPITFRVGGPLKATDLWVRFADNIITDMGNYQITAGQFRGPGGMVLDCGGDLDVTAANGLYITGTLEIANSDSVVDVDGNFTWLTLTMSAGELYLAWADPDWTWSATPTGGTIHYDGAGQSIFNTTYYNMTVAGSATKSLIGDTTVNNLASHTAAIFSLNTYKLLLGSSLEMTGGALLSGSMSSTLENANTSGFSAIIDGGTLNVAGMTVSGTNASGIQFIGNTTFQNFDNVTWQNGAAAGRYIYFGDSTNLTFNDTTWNGHNFADALTYNAECTFTGPSKVVKFTNFSGAGAGETLDLDSSSNGVECLWDTGPPTDAFIYCWDSSAKGMLLGAGHPYPDSTPYFEFSSTDEGGEGGIDGYFYYWGTSASGVPDTWTTGNSASVTCSSGETIYYMRVVAQDYVGGNSANITTFTYNYHIMDALAPQMLYCEGFLYGWPSRRKITFAASSLGTDLNDFPVLVTLNSSNFVFGDAQANGEDARFLDPDGTPLYYEIVSWDQSGQFAEVWVKVPNIPAGSTTDYIWIYYDNPDAVDAQNKEGVWENFEAVYHFEESASDFLDSSANRGFSRPAGGGAVITNEGQVGNNSAFDGVSWAAMDMNYSGGANSLPSVSVTVWFKTEESGGAYNTNWSFADFDRSDHWNFYLRPDTGALEFSTMAAGSSINDFVGVAVGLNDNAWHFGGAVYDGTDSILYVDGSLDNTWSNPHGGLALSTANNRYGFIGDGSEATEFNGGRNYQYYSGLIDELRISNTTRSADWIKAEYLCMTSAFTAVGSQEALDTTLLVLYDSAPEFSAVANHENSSEVATHYEIDISTQSNFSSFVNGHNGVKTAFGSTVDDGDQCADIEIPGGVTWSLGTPYYFRVKFYYDTVESSWSETGQFRTNPIEMDNHRIFFTPSGGGNRFPYSRSEHAANTTAELIDIITAINGDNNSNTAGTGTSSFDLVTRQNKLTIVLLDGTFSDNTTVLGDFDGGNSSANYYITVQNEIAGYPTAGFTPVINTAAGTALHVNASYTKVIGITATGGGAAFAGFDQNDRSYTEYLYCISYGNRRGFRINNGDYCNAFHCESYNNEEHGFFILSDSDYIDIYNCTIHHNTLYGITFNTGSGDLIENKVRECRVYSNDSYGITVSIWTGGVTDLISASVSDCDIFNNNVVGLYVGEFTNSSTYPVVISNNRIYNPSGGQQTTGIQFHNNSLYARIINNTIYNHSTSGIRTSLWTAGIHCNNNIIYIPNNAAAYGYDIDGGSAFAVCDYNDIFLEGAGNIGNWVGAATLDDWRTASSVDANSISVDPRFVDAPNAEFHLKSLGGHWNESTTSWDNDSVHSACIDTGNPDDDYSSEPDPNGSRINQGSYGGTQFASKSYDMDVPQNFRCTDCSSRSLTWAWDEIDNEDGYQILDNNSGVWTVDSIPADSTSVEETLLTPNTTYSRYIRAYISLGTDFRNCAATYSCRAYDRPTSNKYSPDWRTGIYTDGNSMAGFVKWNISTIPADSNITGVRVFAYLEPNYECQIEIDFKNAEVDPESVASGQTLFEFADNSTHYLKKGSTMGYPPDTSWKIEDISSTGTSRWIYDAVQASAGNCVMVILHNGSASTGEYVQFSGWSDTETPKLEVTFDAARLYSDNSNSAAACTLAEMPTMTNDSSTFTFQNRTQITAQVDIGDNPVGTVVELWYAPGNSTQVTGSWSSAGTLTSGYSWEVSGLDYGTSYWFMTSAKNWADIWTGNFSITVWTTELGPQAPSDLLVEGADPSATSLIVYDNTPEFSAVVRHQNTSEVATHYEIEVSTDNATWTVWNTGKFALDNTTNLNNGSRCEDILYGETGSHDILAISTLYHWRIKFFFGAGDTEGSFWAYSTFTTGDDMNHHRLYVKSSGTGNWPFSHPNDALAGITDLKNSIIAIIGDNNSNERGTGTSSYDLTSIEDRFTILFDNGTFNDYHIDMPRDFITSDSSYFTFDRRNSSSVVTIKTSDGASFSSAYIHADYTKIYNLMATGSEAANFSGFYCEASNLIFENCTAFNNVGYGFRLRSITESGDILCCSFINCTADNNSYGLYVHAYELPVGNVTIADSSFHNNITHGINLVCPNSRYLGNVDILDCDIYSNDASGVSLVPPSLLGTGALTNIAISNNRIYSNGYNGIILYSFFSGGSGGSSGPIVFDNNVIYNNGADGEAAGIQLDPPGGFLAQPGIFTITRNRIYCTDDSQDYGIWIASASADFAHIINNTIDNNMRCIRLQSSGISNVHCNNNIIRVKDNTLARGISATYTCFDACDYNNIYVPGQGMVGYDGSDCQSTLADWQAATGLDTYSISLDPRFFSTSGAPSGFDYHLKSTAGRWNGSGWDNDAVTSNCIDAGNPADDYSNETENDGDRINQGTYGGTVEASRSPTFDTPPVLSWIDCTTTSLTWEWTDSLGEEGYDLFDNDSDSIVLTMDQNVTMTVETGLGVNTTYARYLRAFKNPGSKIYSNKSNVILACTLANIPIMDNTDSTFEDITDTTITVQVGDNGNPGGTTIRLWYAEGDEDGPTGAFAQWTPDQTATYNWVVGSGGSPLTPSTFYYFKSQAQNFLGFWTDCCSTTVAKTLPAAPLTFKCVDCSSDSLTWGWTPVGSPEGYDIFDNATDTIVVDGIDGSATFTIEHYLSPNTTYARYIKSIDTLAHEYFYSENQTSTQGGEDWVNACVLTISGSYTAGNYCVITTSLIEGRQNEARLMNNGALARYVYNRPNSESKYQSLMDIDVIEATGGTFEYYYQIKGVNMTMVNCAMIAVKIPSIYYDFVHNASQASTTSTSYQQHTQLTLNPPQTPADYLVFFSSTSWSDCGSIYGNVWSRLLTDHDGNNHYNLRAPVSSTGGPERFTHSGFWPLSGFNSSSTYKDIYFHYRVYRQSGSLGAAYMCNSDIAAMRLGSPWFGYSYDIEGGSIDVQGTPVTLVETTFTPPKAQDYLILASCQITGDNRSSIDYSAWWEVDSNAYDRMVYYPNTNQSSNEINPDRASFSSIRRINLTAASYTVRIRINSGAADALGRGHDGCILALPLEMNRRWSNQSNVAEACTLAAVPYMDNGFATFYNQSSTTISAYVNPNGNPAGTSIGLWYCADDGTNNPDESWIYAGIDASTYTWTVDNSGQGLLPGTTYWFKARARNWVDIWSDCCSITTWSTVPDLGTPENFECIDCSWDSLTWGWEYNGGGASGFAIFDNDTDGMTIASIDSAATSTIETGLMPNTTYARYIKAYAEGKQFNLYAESQTDTYGSSDWVNACTLNLHPARATGNYFVIATAMVTGEPEFEARLIRNSDTINYAKIDVNVDGNYQSFMSTEVLEADGVSSYFYALQVKGDLTTMTNTAIICMELPIDESNYARNLNEISTTSSTSIPHATVNLNPSASSDFLMFFSSSFWANASNSNPFARFKCDSLGVNNYAFQRTADRSERYNRGGFWPLTGVSGSTDVWTAIGESGSTDYAFMCRSNITGLYLNSAIWDGYACNTVIDEFWLNMTPSTLVTKTFTPSIAQNYLIMAHCGLEEGTGVSAQAWWELDSDVYDYMIYNTATIGFIGTYASMRRMYLSAAPHTIRVRAVGGGTWSYAHNATIIAIPLENPEGGVYGNASNVAEACTLAAPPFMDNTASTFTNQTHISIDVTVGNNFQAYSPGNPDGGNVELWYAIGDENGNTAAFQKWNGDDQYSSGNASWVVTGLQGETSYWFKARAQNWAGFWSDYSDLTVWSTLVGPPTNFSCIDCSSDTLTWGWVSNGGEGFAIFDNDTDTVIVSDIDADATWTVETGLDPNVTYKRYICSFTYDPLVYFYNESLTEQMKTLASWWNACVLDMTAPPSGTYLVIATLQGASDPTVGTAYRSEFQFLNSSDDQISYSLLSTDDKFFSFMGMEVASFDGVSDYCFKLQAKSITAGQDTSVQNAAIVAIKLHSSNYSSVKDISEKIEGDGTWENHSTLTVTPVQSGDDYWVIHSSNFKHSTASYYGYSRLLRIDTSDELSYGAAEPYSTDMFYPQGGFSILPGLTGSVMLADQMKAYNSAYNLYEKNVHIAAVRLNDIAWNGYQSVHNYTQTNVGIIATTVIEKSFTLSSAQDYLILASCSIGISGTTYQPYVWWEHEFNSVTNQYDNMVFDERQDVNDRALFAGIRKMSLATGNTHYFRLRARASTGTAYVKSPAIVIIPLENLADLQYGNKSNVVETCTAANVPYMGNSTATFTDRTNSSITAYVNPNGNPADTGIELWYAIGDSGGNTAALTKWNGTLTSGYSWDVTGLEANTSYWFQARAENWRGCFTDFCNITVWSTLPNPPVLSCIGCTSDSLTWMWTDSGGDAFDIFDNDTDTITVADITGTVTSTIETGLSPNTTYGRYIKAYLDNPLTYFYAENLSRLNTQSNTEWKNVCTLDMGEIPGNDYMVIGILQGDSDASVFMSQFRMVRNETTAIGNACYTTYTTGPHTFMASEVLTATGTESYKYQLQMKSFTASQDTYSDNAAIIAIALPTSNHNEIDNLTQGSVASTTWRKHSDAVVVPQGTSDDYWVIHSSNFQHSDITTHGYSRLRRTDTGGVLTYCRREFYDLDDEWYLQGGFSMLKGISANVTLRDEFHSAGVSDTLYEKNVHVAAVRLSDDVWSGYADNTITVFATNSTTGDNAVTKTFNVSEAQNYLIMASCGLRINYAHSSYRAQVWLVHDDPTETTHQYDFMDFRAQDANDRASFATMRRVYLDAGDHTLRIVLKALGATYAASVENASVIAIPLGGSQKEYTPQSNSVEACTAANVPFMDNSMTTFTDQTNDSITVQVGSNGNPAGTSIELWYAIGDENGNTAALTKWNGTLTSGYSWDVTGLEADTSYWFQSRAENLYGYFTDFCNITVWSTEPNGPDNFTCIDCSSTTLTWAWDGQGGIGYTIFDNDTDLPVVTDISPSATYTVETGLSPNTTYNRYIRALITPVTSYYVENATTTQTVTATEWYNACMMEETMQAGNYLVIAKAMFKAYDNPTYDAYCRLLRDEATEISYTHVPTDNFWHSFMGMELLAADGSSTYKYQIQIQSNSTSQYAELTNAAIIAIRLPNANYNYIGNTTEGITQSITPVEHTGLTVTPPSASDYWLIHSSNISSNNTGVTGYSWLTVPGGHVGAYNARRPYNTTTGSSTADSRFSKIYLPTAMFRTNMHPAILVGNAIRKTSICLRSISTTASGAVTPARPTWASRT